MKFYTAPRYMWHRWFAWRPVKLTYENGCWIWLEWIEQQLCPDVPVLKKQYRIISITQEVEK